MKARACGQHRLYEPSTFILSLIHNLIPPKEPRIQRAGNHACCLHTAWLCQLFSAWTWDASVPRRVSFLTELIWWSWVWADCTSCGPMNIVTIITSQLWDEEVAWLSKTGISSYTVLPSSLAMVSRGGWRILITACWLDSRGIAQILLKTQRKVEKYWQRKLMMTTLETLTTFKDDLTTI